MLLLLLAQLLLGLFSIAVSLQHLDGEEMIKLMMWAQHIVTFRGDAAGFVADVALVFKLHLLLGMTIFLVFPFTRLVHVWSGLRRRRLPRPRLPGRAVALSTRWVPASVDPGQPTRSTDTDNSHACGRER